MAARAAADWVENVVSNGWRATTLGQVLPSKRGSFRGTKVLAKVANAVGQTASIVDNMNRHLLTFESRPVIRAMEESMFKMLAPRWGEWEKAVLGEWRSCRLRYWNEWLQAVGLTARAPDDDLPGTRLRRRRCVDQSAATKASNPRMIPAWRRRVQARDAMEGPRICRNGGVSTSLTRACLRVT